MFHPLRTVALALIVVAGLCLAGPAHAGSKVIPATGSVNGQVTLQIDPTPTNPVGRQEYIAQGVGTLIGLHTNRGVTLFTADGKLTGTFTATAADGSTVSGSYKGNFAPIPGTPNFQYTVTVFWEKGTGRLAGVSGGANVSAILNGLTGAFHYDYLGVWILP